MTDGDALYRAILDDPDDDAPRLVWADWLDERGDADRAAFVRYQCEWARLDPGDPRQEVLWERWLGLLDRNRDRWTAGLGDAARNCGFWRGLPDWFDVTTGRLVEQLAELRRHVPAQCLNLYLTGFRDELMRWPGLEAVRCVDITEASADPYYPQSSMRGWVWLIQSPRLRGLRSVQIEMDISSVGVLAAMAGSDWPNLRELSVRLGGADADKPPAAWDDLTAAGWLPGLRSLDVWGCFLGDAGLATLLSAPRPLALTRLNLGINHLSPRGVRLLADSPALGQVQTIELNGNAVGGWVGELLRSPGLPNLTSLMASDVIGSHYSGRDVVRSIAANAPPGRLRVLELHSNGLDAEAVQTLVDSPAVDGLEVLSLNGNNLPDASVEAIAGSSRLARLRRLDLAANQVTDDGLQLLARSGRLPGLRTLTLQHNNLSADGLIDFNETDLARRLWRLETDSSHPSEHRRRRRFEVL
jgi:uncharacterized protein (TIGR02996 family)